MRSLLTPLWLAAAAASVHAQGYPFSQRATLSQRVAFTTISIEYGRPTARGRALFGALVPWDQVWHPGADSATTLTLSHAVELSGRTVAAGSYTTWLIPRATGAWTFILSRATGIQHTPYPGAAADVLRLDVAPVRSTHVETMTFAFPLVLRDSATLAMQWGELGISLPIKARYRPPSP
jgi:hypothetical protein